MSKWKNPLTAAEQKEHAALYAAKVAHDVRISFSLVWFATEREAERYGELNKKLGTTVNGGCFHGMYCVRSPEFDYVKNGQKIFACRD